ncbi:unnamed protein product [Kluyveromyces dobzhanskii CBS 2104]|uniref:WGS project CCBQ000000000 data, contig 00008 n=1 Tax=Kluyveromyces dobzhanskii CBS 2104 TaxID=1427455 RepID=A0A0A8L9T3_9SACH|nr:unnamed protein product [Kluyveromyces dobzhanskii CBS 2104]
MMSKRTLRLLSLTGMVLFVLFFIRHNAEYATRSFSGDSVSNEAKVDNDINNIREGIAGTKGSAVSADVKNADKNVAAGTKGSTDSDLDLAAEVEGYDPAAEYKDILSASPMVVFSKTRCLFSKRIKALLTEYEFDPVFTVIELDTHENGADLQKYIGSKTGRSTVPNVVINGISRGGCDDFVKLDEDKTLLDSLKTWGGSTLSVKKASAAVPAAKTAPTAPV